MNPERTDALIALVQTRDEWDHRRTHKQTQAGAPERFALWADLPRVYVSTRQIEREDGR